MKKVLALVLAVVMICTMAFAAVDIHTNAGNAYTDTTTDPYTKVAPGSVLYFKVSELAGTTGAYMKQVAGANTPADTSDDKYEFVPANNKVSVTYGVGANLVKSQGWVLVGTDGDKGNLDNWQYQIALVANDNAALDEKIDFSITKVVFKATGEKALEYVFDGDTAKGNLPKELFDVGYNTGKITLDKTGKEILTNGLNDKLALNVLTSVNATTKDDGTVVNSNTWTVANIYGDVVYTVNAGQKLLRKNYDASYRDAQGKWDAKYGIADVTVLTRAINDTNLTSGVATILNWEPTWNVYAIDMKGEVSKVSVVVDDGVATAKVPAYSAVILVKGTLKNVGSTIGAAPEVTNPGTGANDVVGVAAALAVVALVSGAAISLKK